MLREASMLMLTTTSRAAGHAVLVRLGSKSVSSYIFKPLLLLVWCECEAKTNSELLMSLLLISYKGAVCRSFLCFSSCLPFGVFSCYWARALERTGQRSRSPVLLVFAELGAKYKSPHRWYCILPFRSDRGRTQCAQPDDMWPFCRCITVSPEICICACNSGLHLGIYYGTWK